MKLETGTSRSWRDPSRRFGDWADDCRKRLEKVVSQWLDGYLKERTDAAELDELEDSNRTKRIWLESDDSVWRASFEVPAVGCIGDGLPYCELSGRGRKAVDLLGRLMALVRRYENEDQTGRKAIYTAVFDDDQARLDEMLDEELL